MMQHLFCLWKLKIEFGWNLKLKMGNKKKEENRKKRGTEFSPFTASPLALSPQQAPADLWALLANPIACAPPCLDRWVPPVRLIPFPANSFVELRFHDRRENFGLA
jgi:hypothetical protein